MGYKVGTYKGKTPFYNAKEILCDTADDLITADKNVSCGAGSKAIILETSEIYIKNTSGEWKLQTSSGGGGDIDPDATYIYDGGLIV